MWLCTVRGERNKVRRNVASFAAALPSGLRDDLRGAGLLDERAPTRR